MKNNYNINYKIIDKSYSTGEQLMLQSLCDHNIIANITFSLWGAYLNRNINKLTFYPRKKTFPSFMRISRQLNFTPIYDKIIMK